MLSAVFPLLSLSVVCPYVTVDGLPRANDWQESHAKSTGYVNLDAWSEFFKVVW